MTLYAASAEPQLSQPRTSNYSKTNKKKNTQFAVNIDYSEYMACESSTDVKQFNSKGKFSELL